MTFLALLAITAIPAAAAAIVHYPFTADTASSAVGPGITPTLNLSTLSQAYAGNDGFGNVLEAYPTAGSTSAAEAKANGS